jgi:hypothetical protein
MARQISDEMIDDILTTAFESGLSWIGAVRVERWPNGAEYASDVVSRGGTVMIDTEDGTHILDRASIERGIRRAVREDDTIQEWYDNNDANDASDALQYALFNELIYG